MWDELTLSLILMGTYIAYMYVLHLLRIKDIELIMHEQMHNVMLITMEEMHNENTRLIKQLTSEKI